jgi:hypothetical protein
MRHGAVLDGSRRDGLCSLLPLHAWQLLVCERAAGWLRGALPARAILHWARSHGVGHVYSLRCRVLRDWLRAEQLHGVRRRDIRDRVWNDVFQEVRCVCGWVVRDRHCCRLQRLRCWKVWNRHRHAHLVCMRGVSGWNVQRVRVVDVQLLRCGHVLIGDGCGVFCHVLRVCSRQLRVGIWADVGMPVAVRRWALLYRVGSDVVGCMQPLFRGRVRDGVRADGVRRMLAVLSWEVLDSVWGCCFGHVQCVHSRVICVGAWHVVIG